MQQYGSIAIEHGSQYLCHGPGPPILLPWIGPLCGIGCELWIWADIVDSRPCKSPQPTWHSGWGLHGTWAGWHCRINRIHYKIGKIATLMLFLGPLGSDEEWSSFLIFGKGRFLRKGYYMPNDVFIFKYLSRSLSLSLCSILVRAYYILVCPWVT